MTKQNEITATVLTVDELKRMGEILSDMREIIELYNHALNVTPAPRDIEDGALTTHYHALYALSTHQKQTP